VASWTAPPKVLTLLPIDGTYIISVPEADVSVTGSPKAYLDKKTTSGVDMQRWFCGDCGSPVMSTTPVAPGITCKPFFMIYTCVQIQVCRKFL
jgi:hypothetical protein